LKSERKVQYLTHLHVTADEGLLLIEVKGYTNHGYPGIPKLAPVLGIGDIKEDRMLELDFINQFVKDESLSDVQFNLKTILDLSKFRSGIDGVKVNAENNADIALLI
jgi:hypothetical protein